MEIMSCDLNLLSVLPVIDLIKPKSFAIDVI